MVVVRRLFMLFSSPLRITPEQCPFSLFTKSEGTLPHSQAPATHPYLEPSKYHPYLPISFLEHQLYYYPVIYTCLLVTEMCPETCRKFSFHPLKGRVTYIYLFIYFAAHITKPSAIQANVRSSDRIMSE